MTLDKPWFMGTLTNRTPTFGEGKKSIEVALTGDSPICTEGFADAHHQDRWNSFHYTAL